MRPRVKKLPVTFSARFRADLEDFVPVEVLAEFAKTGCPVKKNVLLTIAFCLAIIFAFVWKLDNGKYATNTKMFKGDVDSFGKEQIYEAATLFRPLGAVLPASGGLHLHGGMDLNYDSERFSEFDYQGFSSPDALNLDLYLMTPENSFQKLSPNKDVEMHLPEVDVK